jgi:hypothetical protein
MQIKTEFDPTRPLNQKWKAVTENYDGAEDSPTRHQIGWGMCMQAAIEDLKEQLEAS